MTDALLGGHLIDGDTRLDVSEEGDILETAYGRVIWKSGLPSEFRPGVVDAVPRGIAITVAAHDPGGSAVLAFHITARMLRSFLNEGIPDRDESILELHSTIRDESYEFYRLARERESRGTT